MHGWLTVVRQWLGVEPHLTHGAPRSDTTSEAERRHIDNQIRRQSRELDSLLAQASLDYLRSRDDEQGHRNAP